MADTLRLVPTRDDEKSVLTRDDVALLVETIGELEGNLEALASMLANSVDDRTASLSAENERDLLWLLEHPEGEKWRTPTMDEARGVLRKKVADPT